MIPNPSLRVTRQRLASGVELEVAEQGVRGGVPVLLLHGITDSWRSFEPVLPYLPVAWHVVAISQRGHGGSDNSVQGWRTRDFAADAAALITQLGLAPAVVVGHSMGSSNALRLAIDHPALVRGLVLAGAFASYGDKPELVDFVRNMIGSIGLSGERVPRELARQFQQDTLAGPVADGLLDTMVDECLRTPAHVWRGAFDGLLEDDFSAELHRVAAPTRLIWPDADAFVPRADQDRLLAAIPGAQLTVYEGIGHALHWERPVRFATDVMGFVQSLPAQTPRVATTA